MFALDQSERDDENYIFGASVQLVKHPSFARSQTGFPLVGIAMVSPDTMQDEDNPGLIWISMFRSGVLTRPAIPFWMAGLHVFQHPGGISAQAMIGIIGAPCDTGAAPTAPRRK
jgi:hypothetical protein